MSQPFVGEIRMFGGNFPPNGWLFCEGQLLSIAENETLFQLIGTTYGGDGESTFALPDLRGRIPIHMGTGSGLTNRVLGETGGQEQVTLTTNQIPAHAHAAQGTSADADRVNPKGAFPARTRDAAYGIPGTSTAMLGTVGSTGGSQPHTNMQPYLCISFIISLYGIFPSPP